MYINPTAQKSNLPQNQPSLIGSSNFYSCSNPQHELGGLGGRDGNRVEAGTCHPLKLKYLTIENAEDCTVLEIHGQDLERHPARQAESLEQ